MKKRSVRNSMRTLFLSLFASTLLVSCGKSDSNPTPANTDEAAAARIVGSYKGTIQIASQDYFNATINITKESGNKVKIAPKSGEAYSTATPKIIAIQAIAGSQNAVGDDPNGILTYTAAQKTLNFISKATATGDVVFRFEGTKQ